MSDILFECFVPGRPVPKKEYRANRRGGRIPDKRDAITAWKETLAICINGQKNLTEINTTTINSMLYPLDEPLELYLYFCFEAPAKVRRAIFKHKALYMLKSTQPDFDNLSKPVCDALERCGVVVRDSRFCVPHLPKLWTLGDPGVQIYICKPEQIYFKSIEIT